MGHTVKTSSEVTSKIIALLQETNLPVRKIAAQVKVNATTVTRICRRELGNQFYDTRVARLAAAKPSRIGLSSDGYRLIPAPNWWRGSIGGNGRGTPYVKEHQLVYCEANNLNQVPSGCVIHHLNGDKLDNSLENLELMSRANHMKHHNPRSW